MMHQVNHREDRAEGDIVLADGRFPYDTDLISINGVNLHVWLGDTTATPALLERLEKVGRRHRDVVRCTYCSGAPTGYWARQDMFEHRPQPEREA